MAASASRNVDFLDADQGAPPERQIDGGAVPVLEPDEAARRHRERHDRPPRFPCQHDDAEPGHARALGDIGGQRDITTVLQRAHHLLEGAHTTFAVESAAVVAGTSDRSDTEPLGGDGVELAVAVPRDQDPGLVGVLVLDEGGEEVLAVPEGEDRGDLRLDDVVDVGRIEREFVGPPDKAQIFGRQDPDGTLNEAASQRIAKQFFQRAGS